MNLLEQPYPSRRYPMVGYRGAVATSQPLAVLAGLEILQAGGNAVDAIVATATTLTVVEPTGNGIGADAFALVWDGKRLHGLNGSGRAPAALTVEAVRAAGYTAMPARGWLTVTVPGAPRTWRDLHDRFGRLSFEQVLQPAIRTAEAGYAVTPVTARSSINRCSPPECTRSRERLSIQIDCPRSASFSSLDFISSSPFPSRPPSPT